MCLNLFLSLVALSAAWNFQNLNSSFVFFPSFPRYAVFTALTDGRPLLSLAVVHCSRSLGIRFLEDKLWHAFHSVWYVFSRVCHPSLFLFSFLFSMVTEGWFLMVNSINIDIMFLLFDSFMFCLLLTFHQRTNASNSYFLDCSWSPSCFHVKHILW